MHITQVLLSPRIGGAETMVNTLAQEWASMGVESSTVYLDDETRPRGRLARLLGLRRQLGHLAPDVVLAHSYLPAIYARIAWGRRGPVHSVLHSASDDFAHGTSRALEHVLRQWTTSVIAVGRNQLDVYEAHFGRGIPTTVIPNGIGKAFRPRPSVSPEPRVVVTLARVASQKRPAFWNHVVRRASSAAPGLEFQWWGPRSGDVELDALVDDPELTTGRFMGATNEPASALRWGDVLFHPAAREAHSLALLEAIMTGMPVVYADTIEPPDDSSVWRFRYASDNPEDALRVLSQVVDEWEGASLDALDYAYSHGDTYNGTRTAAQYLAWIEERARRRNG